MHQRVYFAIWPKVPLAIRKRLPTPINANAVNEKVAQTLSLLDAKGVPNLVAAFNDHNGGVRRVAALAVGGMLLSDQIAAESTPGLSSLLSDPDGSVRGAALSTLERLGTGAKAAVPALIEAAQDPRPDQLPTGPGLGFRAQAVRILGLLGPEAKAAVPVLIQIVGSSNATLRVQAAVALWRINRDTNMVQVLTAELDRAPFLLYQSDVVSVLGEMGPAAKPAVPVIVRILENRPINPFGIADYGLELTALDRIDREAAQAVRRKQEAQRQALFVFRQWPLQNAERSNQLNPTVGSWGWPPGLTNR
jgi:hypothetical protein